MYACSKNGENEGKGQDGFHGTVMKSIDGGVHWFSITQGLADQEFYKIIVSKNSPDILFLATQRSGVFRSINGGNSWEPWNEGLSNLVAGTNGNNVTNTMILSADGEILYFGSSGSGVFRRAINPRQLEVSKHGIGTGLVVSHPSGIKCGSDCAEDYATGMEIVLTATPEAGSVFTGWEGEGCGGTGQCIITMDGDKSVTAVFELTEKQYLLWTR